MCVLVDEINHQTNMSHPCHKNLTRLDLRLQEEDTKKIQEKKKKKKKFNYELSEEGI